MDTFPDFETSFWRKYLFFFYKMFFNKKTIEFHLHNLDKEEFDEAIKNFQLEKMKPGVYEMKQDTIFLRGSCELNELGIDKSS